MSESFSANEPERPDFYRLGAFVREDSPGYLMRRIMQVVVNQLDRRLEVGELTYAQWAPLYLIQRMEGPTLATLARRPGSRPLGQASTPHPPGGQGPVPPRTLDRRPPRDAPVAHAGWRGGHGARARTTVRDFE